MLKIKGLKKKKKGKKGKHKEDDLFDPEELEQYRREHQQKAQTSDAPEPTGEGTSSSEKSEEWKKFQALTGGVDDILKKTQADLDRIKSTSYYQRKQPEPSNTKEKDPTKWAKFEEGSAASKETEVNYEENTEAVHDEFEEAAFAVEEEEEESEQDEDIFDTSYVDAVASGEVKLAYIPDSPAEEETGPDPFDTSIVDKVIKVDPKKKNLVSLGCAVEVLTGRVDKTVPVAEALPKKRNRPKRRDLLLGSFEELETSEETTSTANEPPPKSILDEEPEYVPEEIDLSINLATVLAPPSPLVEKRELGVGGGKDTVTSKSIVEEFDVVVQASESVAPEEVYDELDDEFAALAQESLLKEPVKDPLLTDLSETEETDPDDADPFDTAFAANVLPGKYELKLIEEEILFKEHELPKVTLPKQFEAIPSVRLNDGTNEHNFLEEEQIPLSFIHRDLLGGSTTDLTKISDCPIEPTAPKEESDELTYSDPFDTSVVEVLVAPGKTELKFLEKEFLDEVVSQIRDDDDFDPRAESPQKLSKPSRPDQLPVGEKRFSISKVVAFNIQENKPEVDLLAVDQEETSKVSKPLTPYYANPEEVNNRQSCESESNFEDPFDTSFAIHAPGKAELKLLESELVSENTLTRDLSDPDFNPREHIEADKPVKPAPPIPPQPSKPIQINTHHSPERLQLDILTADTEITIKLHTPVEPKKIEKDLEDFGYKDPFDTSIVNNILPGKAELKLLESELINSDSGSSIKRSYTDPDFNPRDSPEKELVAPEPQVISNFIDHSEDTPHISEKPLTPKSATSNVSFDIGGDIDPFDTSCVDNLAPGKAELKLLESELID